VPTGQKNHYFPKLFLPENMSTSLTFQVYNSTMLVFDPCFIDSDKKCSKFLVNCLQGNWVLTLHKYTGENKMWHGVTYKISVRHSGTSQEAVNVLDKAHGYEMLESASSMLAFITEEFGGRTWLDALRFAEKHCSFQGECAVLDPSLGGAAVRLGTSDCLRVKFLRDRKQVVRAFSIYLRDKEAMDRFAPAPVPCPEPEDLDLDAPTQIALEQQHSGSNRKNALKRIEDAIAAPAWHKKLNRGSKKQKVDYIVLD
jgi:hypothetical protein